MAPPVGIDNIAVNMNELDIDNISVYSTTDETLNYEDINKREKEETNENTNGNTNETMKGVSLENDSNEEPKKVGVIASHVHENTHDYNEKDIEINGEEETKGTFSNTSEHNETTAMLNEHIAEPKEVAVLTSHIYENQNQNQNQNNDVEGVFSNIDTLEIDNISVYSSTYEPHELKNVAVLASHVHENQNQNNYNGEEEKKGVSNNINSKNQSPNSFLNYHTAEPKEVAVLSAHIHGKTNSYNIKSNDDNDDVDEHIDDDDGSVKGSEETNVQKEYDDNALKVAVLASHLHPPRRKRPQVHPPNVAPPRRPHLVPYPPNVALPERPPFAPYSSHSLSQRHLFTDEIMSGNNLISVFLKTVNNILTNKQLDNNISNDNYESDLDINKDSEVYISFNHFRQNLPKMLSQKEKIKCELIYLLNDENIIFKENGIIISLQNVYDAFIETKLKTLNDDNDDNSQSHDDNMNAILIHFNSFLITYQITSHGVHNEFKSFLYRIKNNFGREKKDRYIISLLTSYALQNLELDKVFTTSQSEIQSGEHQERE
jgi:hypothetical protein